MKEQYIKQVKHELTVSRQAKQEIVRDLAEAFASASEHGETEEQVIERLGAPKQFAESMEEQIGSDRAKHRRRKKLVPIYCAFMGALLFFTVYFVTRAFRLPDHVIGQADSMTGIQVEAPFTLDFMNFILLSGIAALAVAVILTMKYIRSKRSNDRKDR